MSETKHTPGPWIIVKHGTDADIETRQDSGMVCCVATVWTRGERQEANAHLVAAAPEMLQELLECRKELLGASSYLATCDPVTIVQNLESFVASLRRRLASVEAVIEKIDHLKGKG